MDPELKAYIAFALKNSYSLKSVWYRFVQSEALAAKAGADLKPTLNAEAGGSLTRQDTVRGSRTQNENFSAGLVAQYEVDLWGRIQSEMDAAIIDAKVSELDLEVAILSLSANVASAYFDLKESLLQIRLLDDQLRANHLILKLTDFRFNQGLTSASDVLRQKQLIESRIADRLSAKRQYLLHENRLALLLGQSVTSFTQWRQDQNVPVPDLHMRIEPELDEAEILKLSSLFDPDIKTQLIETPPDHLSEVPAELIHIRPDVIRAIKRIEGADRRLAAAIADRFPKLTLVARTETSADAINDVFDNWLASIAANLVAPILDGGRRKAEVDRVTAQKQALIQDYRQTALEAIKEVEDGLISFKWQRALLAQIDEELEVSLKLLTVVKDGYASGREDYLRVLDALVNYQSLQRQRVTTEKNVAQAYIDVVRSLSIAPPVNTISPDAKPVEKHSK